MGDNTRPMNAIELTRAIHEEIAAALAARDDQWERAYREAYGKRRFGEPEWAIERRLSEGLAAIRERLKEQDR